jgi:hypothetical protein
MDGRQAICGSSSDVMQSIHASMLCP